MDIKKLKGIMAEQEVTGEKLATVIGVTPKPFYRKMKNGVFRTDEAAKIAEYLKISEPARIFLRSK